MKWILGMLVSAGLCACALFLWVQPSVLPHPLPPTAPAAPPCDKKWAYWAVLDKLNPVLYFNTSEELTLDDIVRHERKVSCVREWVKQNVKDPCTMEAYAEWLDSYSTEDVDARKKLSEPAHEDSYQKQERERKEHTADFLKHHDVPVPTGDACDIPTMGRVRR